MCQGKNENDWSNDICHGRSHNYNLNTMSLFKMYIRNKSAQKERLTSFKDRRQKSCRWCSKQLFSKNTRNHRDLTEHESPKSPQKHQFTSKTCPTRFTMLRWRLSCQLLSLIEVTRGRSDLALTEVDG